MVVERERMRGRDKENSIKNKELDQWYSNCTKIAYLYKENRIVLLPNTVRIKYYTCNNFGNKIKIRLELSNAEIIIRYSVEILPNIIEKSIFIISILS